MYSESLWVDRVAAIVILSASDVLPRIREIQVIVTRVEDDYAQVRMRARGRYLSLVTERCRFRVCVAILRARTRDHRGPRGLVFLALLAINTTWPYRHDRRNAAQRGATRRLRHRPADVNKETCARRDCRAASIFLSGGLAWRDSDAGPS